MKRIYDYCIKSQPMQGLIAVLRNLLGPRDVCIFLVTCPAYADYHLRHSPWYKAIILIGLRLLSCNPVTGLVRLASTTWLKHKNGLRILKRRSS